MHIDPTNTAPMQPPVTHERYNISMRHNRCLVHSLVVGKQLCATALVADEELAEDEVVATHLVAAQEPVQFSRIRRAIGEEPDPDRRIDQDDHAVA